MFHITVTPLKLQKMKNRKERLLDIKRRDPLLWESKGAQKSMRTFLTMKKSIWKLIRPKRDMKIKALTGSVWVCSPSENTKLSDGFHYLQEHFIIYLSSLCRYFEGSFQRDLLAYSENTLLNYVIVITSKSIPHQHVHINLHRCEKYQALYQARYLSTSFYFKILKPSGTKQLLL